MSEDEILQVKRQYHKKLSQKADVLDSHMSNIEKSTLKKQAYDALCCELHKLKGSLGMYGYVEQEHQAQMLMDMIESNDENCIDEQLQKMALSLRVVSKSELVK